MAGCCDQDLKFEGVSRRYKTILWIIIAMNASMFLVEMLAGIAANSMALQADALDFLGDSLTYSLTLLAIGQALHWRARAAMVKGISLLLMGVWVFGSTVYQVWILGVPNEVIMSGVAMLAFAVNMACVLLLLRYREGDANVRSVWLCSRNDAIGNVAVLVAAGVVFLTQSAWPDLIVAFLMAGLFLHSASLIIRQARQELRSAKDSAVASSTPVPEAELAEVSCCSSDKKTSCCD